MLKLPTLGHGHDAPLNVAPSLAKSLTRVGGNTLSSALATEEAHALGGLGPGNPGGSSSNMRASSHAHRRSVSARQASSMGLSSSMKILGWEAQAAQAVSGAASLEGHRWRSAAIYCEVKLTEALANAQKKSNAATSASETNNMNTNGTQKNISVAAAGAKGDNNSTAPDVGRTAICMHLLGDLSAMAGPFRRVLQHIHHELALAVYSDYYGTAQALDAAAGGDGNNATLAQEPYFRVVRRLEEERAEMTAEREQFNAELIARAGDIGRIEERIMELEDEVAEARAEAAQLQTQLAERDEALSNARAETRASKEELRRLRKELLTARDDAQAVRQTGRQAATDAAESERVKKQVEMLQKELARALAEAEKEKQRADSLEKSGAAERAAAEAALIAASHRRVATAAPVQAVEAPRSMTPRPDWDELRPFGDEPVNGTTSDTVKEMNEKMTAMKKDLAETRSAKGDLEMAMEETLQLLVVDPETHGMDPQVLAEQLAEFEGDAAPSAASMALAGDGALQRVASLGTGPEVPRYLRQRSKIVRMNQLSKRDCEELVNDVWEAKDEFDATRHTTMSLASFLFDFLRKRHGTQRETAQAGYEFHAALRRYNYDADVELFHKVLTGEISEEVRGDRERLVAGLQRALGAASKAYASSTGSGGDDDGEAPKLCPRSEFVSIITSFFSGKRGASLKAILRGLDEDQSGDGPVDVEALFEEDEDHNQGAFIETILDQHLTEVQEYAKSLEECILALSDNDEVLLSDIKSAITTFDSQKPAAEVEAYMARGAKLGALADVREMEAAGHMMLPKVFVTRLRTGLVKRSDNYDAAAAMATVLELFGGAAAPEVAQGTATLSQPEVA